MVLLSAGSRLPTVTSFMCMYSSLTRSLCLRFTEKPTNIAAVMIVQNTNVETTEMTATSPLVSRDRVASVAAAAAAAVRLYRALPAPVRLEAVTSGGGATRAMAACSSSSCAVSATRHSPSTSRSHTVFCRPTKVVGASL